MYAFHKIVEKRIKEAEKRGEFDDLPGSGEPLTLEDDSQIPEDLRLAYKILKNLPNVNYYMVNTGEIGETGDLHGKIGVNRTIAILDSLFREGLDIWVDSPTGLQIPRAIRLVDDIFLHPEKLFRREEFLKKLEEFYLIVQEALEKLGENLHPKIKGAFKRVRV